MTDAEKQIEDIINAAEKTQGEVDALRKAVNGHSMMLEHLSNEISLLVILAKYNKVIDVCIEEKVKGAKDGNTS